jgi:vacuolar-type H+-ATPase subunit H
VSSSDRPARRREIEDSTAARLAEIVAAAERAAKQVIDEAEEAARSRLTDASEEADRIVAERLAGLAELTDEINAQAEALKQQATALQRALAQAKAGLGEAGPAEPASLLGRRASDIEPEAAFDPGQNGAHKPFGPALSIVGSHVEEEPKGERRGDAPEAGGEPTGNGTPAGARLLATQMAVSGSSRAEIEARLRNGFAISDTRAILDAILGPEN